MKFRYLLYLVYIYLLFVVNSNAWGQCTQKLLQAERKYEEGKLNEVPSIIWQCFENGSSRFSKSEKQRAYRLLTLTYLYNNQMYEAEEALINLLKLNPEYQINAADPGRLVSLLSSFRTTPVALIGITGLIEHSFPIQLNTSNNNSSNNEITYSGRYNASFGLSVELPILRQLDLSTQLIVGNSKYISETILRNNQSTSFEETLFFLSLPIGVKYFINSGRARPFLALGINTSFLLSANTDVTQTIVESEFTPKTTQQNILELRDKINYGMYGGVGVRYKFRKRIMLAASINYQNQFNNIVNENNRFNNQLLQDEFGYIDNNFIINRLYFSASVLYMIYKPKKITN